MKGSRWRTLAPWSAIVVVLVLIAVMAGSPSQQGGYLDPDGTGPMGLKAMRTLLTDFGARVDVAYDPSPDADVMFIASDVIADEDLEVVERWVEAGGILVLADPWSALTPATISSSGFYDPVGEVAIPAGTCDIPALQALERLALQYEPYKFGVTDGLESCFGDGVDAVVVAKQFGEGAIVAVAGPDYFVNQNLDKGDNAGLAVSLLAPQSGTRVLMLERGPNSPGADPSLSDTIPSGVKMALVQLFAAFSFYAWFRGRRLGKPIVEHQPVQIEGSELVVAVGGLVRSSRNPTAGASVLRSNLRRQLTSRLGMAPQVDPHVLTDAVVERSGLDPQRVMLAVGDFEVADDEHLLELSQIIDTIHKEVLDGPV